MLIKGGEQHGFDNYDNGYLVYWWRIRETLQKQYFYSKELSGFYNYLSKIQ